MARTPMTVTRHNLKYDKSLATT